jgi:hypothetical protein
VHQAREAWLRRRAWGEAKRNAGMQGQFLVQDSGVSKGSVFTPTA